MNTDFLKQILTLTNNLITGNFDGAKEVAEKIGAMELTEDNIQNVKDAVRGNHSKFDMSQIEQIIDSLKLEDKEILSALIELEKNSNNMNKVLSTEEVKALKGYSLAKAGSITDETDRYNILYGLTMLAIGTRDSALILEILELME